MEYTNKYVQRFEEALIAKGTAESNFYKMGYVLQS